VVTIHWGVELDTEPRAEEGSTTAVARVVVSPNGRIEGRLLPALIEAPGHPVLPGSAS
jgi:hypothetical protein